MSNEGSVPLWKFEEAGTVRGYYLVKDLSFLGDFYECSPWKPVENSLWRSDREEGEVIGYYLVQDDSGLGRFYDFGMKAKKKCSEYDGAHRCEKPKWRKKKCCCIWADGDEEDKIPTSCKKK